MQEKSLIVAMAGRYSMEPAKFVQALKATVVPKGASDEQFAAFLMVAKEYDLNPLTKEIFAFPSRGGGITPVVSVDGWIKMANSHPQFDGLETEDHLSEGKLAAITCRVYRKDRGHPTTCTEYMEECRRSTDVWRQWPARMLRHKATIQALRLAFGFSGIVEPDEAERHVEPAKDVTPAPASVADVNALLEAEQSPAVQQVKEVFPEAQVVEVQQDAEVEGALTAEEYAKLDLMSIEAIVEAFGAAELEGARKLAVERYIQQRKEVEGA